MNKLLLPIIAAAFAFGPTYTYAAKAAPQALTQSPPPAPYKAVSSLVKLPDFLPGMGQLFVDPTTLPAGPFLAYDHKGKLVSTIYMIPLANMKPDFNLNDLKTAGVKINHVDMMYNAGHPGVAEPHIHIVLWNVSPKDEARVAK
ncbi:MAG: hypothetical protein ABI228_07510 [Burkholderiaceae bacterium]